MRSPYFMKIKVEDLSDKVYKTLKKAITTRVLEPEQRIDINRLTEQMGVSRTPIKDAISRLSSEGLITVKSKKGTYVTRFTAEDMLQLFAIRMLLETGFCKDIAQHAAIGNIKALEQNIELSSKMLDGPAADFDYFAYNELDSKFHEELLRASGNNRLVQLYHSLNFHTQVARFYFNQYAEKSRKGQQQHKAILEAINRKDVTLLEQVVRSHISEGMEEVMKMAQQIDP